MVDNYSKMFLCVTLFNRINIRPGLRNTVLQTFTLFVFDQLEFLFSLSPDPVHSSLNAGWEHSLQTLLLTGKLSTKYPEALKRTIVFGCPGHRLMRTA